MKESPKITLSYWEQNSFLAGIDVAIIGCGIVGLSTAIFLKKKHPKLNVTIFERGTMPLGASTRNAGFACFGSISELLEDLTYSTENEVFQLVETRWRGLQKLRKLIGDAHLNYQNNGGYEIFKSEERNQFETCAEKINSFNSILKSIIGTKEVFSIANHQIADFGFNGISNMILNCAEGQLDTGEMMKNLIKLATDHEINLFFGINIEKVEDLNERVILLTEQGWEINAGKAVITTNGFAKNLISNLDIQPARNQVLITKPVRNLPFKGTFHYDRGYYYFRNIDEPKSLDSSRILFGGGRNLFPDQETTTEFSNTPNIQNALQEIFEGIILPNQPIEIDYWWSGILGIGKRKKPIVEMVSPKVGVAVRLGGMGVAIGSQIGEDAAIMIS